MNGDSIAGNSYADVHSFGEKGVFTDSMIIPKLYGSCNWTFGNELFLLGGEYYGEDEGFTLPAEAMWKYNIDSNKWAWIDGAATFASTAPSYGIQGIADSTNYPGGRVNTATWTDKQGNFWLFGGASWGGFGNDLWKYDVISGWWTWMKGPNTYDEVGYYGNKGVEDSLNNPPSRWMVENWTDKDGNLWLFGGLHSGAGAEYKNDLWRYNISTNNWTWMKGDTGWFGAAVYGTLGVPDPANTPGGRQNNRLHWVDSMGNLYLFGGWTEEPFQGYYYDLWKYTVSTNEWTWIGGTSQVNSSGLAYTLCSNNNLIASRSESTGWIDKQGNFWLFGGDTNFENPNYSNSTNDMWKYDPYHNEWWWIGGNNEGLSPGTYGIQGEADFENEPRSRYGSVSWVDSSGNFWIWGGTYIVLTDEDFTLNDLWRYKPDSTCGVYTGSQGPFNLHQDGFLITPNPASTSINVIYSIDQNAELTITDAFGIEVKKALLPSTSKTLTIDINDLNAGIYLITMDQQNRTLTRKLVVIK